MKENREALVKITEIHSCLIQGNFTHAAMTHLLSESNFQKTEEKSNNKKVNTWKILIT